MPDPGARPAGLFITLEGPDGSGKSSLLPRLAAVLEAARPQVVLTFGPDGITGHEDHVAIGAAATDAFHAARAAVPGGGAFARLLHLALPVGRLERLNELLRERGLEPLDPSQPFVPRGVPDETIADFERWIADGLVWDVPPAQAEQDEGAN